MLQLWVIGELGDRLHWVRVHKPRDCFRGQPADMYLFVSFLTILPTKKNVASLWRYGRSAPVCVDGQQLLLVFLRPTLAIPAGRTIECSFSVLLHCCPFLKLQVWLSFYTVSDVNKLSHKHRNLFFFWSVEELPDFKRLCCSLCFKFEFSL